jgi:hypothetical protein
MVTYKAAPKFSVEIVKAIVGSLPKPLSERRAELLPRILHEWSHTSLREHLSRESRATIRRRMEAQDIVAKCARRLLEAFDAIDHRDRTAIIVQMIVAEGRHPEEVSPTEVADRHNRLNEEQGFLRKLAGIAPRQFWNLRRGGPRNLAAYLVLQDAAAIFEWLTGLKASRGVDRIHGTETGPFHRFVSTVWPVVFGTQAGLSAAMKNWALARSRYQERSAVMANMAFQHPTWGIFER